MPSVGRGVYRWLFHGSATLEDLADRLNHVWTVGLLLVIASVVSWRQVYSSPIACLCPPHFTFAQAIFTHNLCWNNRVLYYPIKFGDDTSVYDLLDENGKISQLPQSTQSTTDKFNTDITYTEYTALYQWIPLILCFQALLFKLPNLLLYAFHSYSGISFDKIADLTRGYDKLNLHERQLLGRQIARYVYRWCRQCGGLPWRQLTLLWLLVKVMFFVNAVVQLNAFDKFLNMYDPPYENSTWYGDVIENTLLSEFALVWKTSRAFPRRMFCNIDIMQLTRTEKYIVQCQLPANEFTEQAMMYLWVWFVFVTIVTGISIVVWVPTVLLPILRKRYIQRVLEVAEGFDMPLSSSFDFDKFCNTVGEDGVIVLKLIGANSSELMVKEIVCNMWLLSKPDGGQGQNIAATGYGHPGYIPLSQIPPSQGQTGQGLDQIQPGQFQSQMQPGQVQGQMQLGQGHMQCQVPEMAPQWSGQQQTRPVQSMLVGGHPEKQPLADFKED